MQFKASFIHSKQATWHGSQVVLLSNGVEMKLPSSQLLHSVENVLQVKHGY